MGVQAGTRPAVTLADLAAGYPGWHAWRGRDGRGADQGWFVTRRRRLSAADATVGPAATLSTDDALALESILEQQRVIAEQTAGGEP